MKKSYKLTGNELLWAAKFTKTFPTINYKTLVKKQFQY